MRPKITNDGLVRDQQEAYFNRLFQSSGVGSDTSGSGLNSHGVQINNGGKKERLLVNLDVS